MSGIGSRSIYLLLLILVALAACRERGLEYEENMVLDPPFIESVLSIPNQQLKPDRYHVAFLIMDGVYNTELTAPFDVFQHTQFREGIKAMNVFLVADTYDPIYTFEGIRLLPDFNYLEDSLPPIDILVIPSAEHHLDSDLENEVMIDWVRKVGQKAMFITSHCDGAFVLAEAGLLDGLTCTTFPSDIDKMQARYPHLDIRKDLLFVHDGPAITSAGGAKSFEAALYLTEYLYGQEITRSIAQGLVIDWDLSKVAHLVIDESEPESTKSE